MSKQLKFFLFSEADDYQEQSGRAQWRADEQVLMLAQNQQPRLSTSSWDEGQTIWKTALPVVVDAFSAIGEITLADQAIGFKSLGQQHFKLIKDEHSKPVSIENGQYTDLHFGGDSRLAVTMSDTENEEYALGVFHLRKRWYKTIPLKEAPIRVWTDEKNNSWVLCQTHLYQCSGQPLPHRYTAKADRFEPEHINQKPLRIVDKLALPAEITQPLAICEDGLHLYVLAEVLGDENKQQIFIHPLQEEGQWLALDLPENLTYGTDIHPVENNRIAFMLPRIGAESSYKKRDCPILQLRQNNKGQTIIQLLRQRYPMLSQERARFASSEDRKLRYISADGPRELYPLAQARFFKDANFIC